MNLELQSEPTVYRPLMMKEFEDESKANFQASQI